LALIGFTVFKDKILTGRKTQTIRLKRKRLPRKGETLHLYWKLRTKQCQRLMSVPCQEILIKRWKEMKNDLDLALRDGFSGLREFRDFFEKRYHPEDDTEFMIVRW